MKTTKFSFLFLLMSLSFVTPLETYAFGDAVKRAAENVTEKTVILSKTAGVKATDASITSAVKASLLADTLIEAYRINVDTKKRVVYLKGSVPDKVSMIRAIDKAQQIKGVRTVVNMLMVYP